MASSVYHFAAASCLPRLPSSVKLGQHAALRHDRQRAGDFKLTHCRKPSLVCAGIGFQ